MMTGLVCLPHCSPPYGSAPRVLSSSWGILSQQGNPTHRTTATRLPTSGPSTSLATAVRKWLRTAGRRPRLTMQATEPARPASWAAIATVASSR